MKRSLQNPAYSPDTKPPTIFLPGWGFDGKILGLLRPSPAWVSPETMLDPDTFSQDLLQLLAARKFPPVRIIGWSMGAMLGLQFAATHPDMVASLVLLALRGHWPAQEIHDLKTDFARNPEPFARGFYRKCFLGDKKAYRSFCETLEPLYLKDLAANADRLQRGLSFLRDFRTPAHPPAIPTRLIHGRQDIIAPAGCMAAIPGAVIEMIDNAGHAVLFHENCSLQHELKKLAVQAKFSRAADSYDSYAKVQAEVARKLAERLPRDDGKTSIKTILEIGCGTGNFTSMLVERFPAADIVALDFSPGMIEKARAKLEQKQNIKFICAEAEQYLEDAPEKSFDLVASNGSLQWFTDINRTVNNIARILCPAGQFFCSVFGPGSLPELASGLREILGLEKMLAAETFPGPDRLRTVLPQYFKNAKIEEELLVKEYPSAHDLLLHIKKTGTAGWHHKMQHPITPSRVIRLGAWFQKTYGICRVTYQILFLHGNR